MRTILKIPIALILLFVAAVALTFYLVTQTPLPHRVANRLLTSYVGSRYDVDVTFGDLHGSLWSDLQVDNVTVDFEAAPHRYRLIKIKRLSAYYSLANFLEQPWKLDSLVLTEPLVVLRTDQAGNLLLPSIGGTSQGNDRHFDSSIDRLRIVDGRFQLFRPSAAYLIDSIEIAATASYEKGLLDFLIESLSLVYPQRGFRLENLRLDGALSQQALGVDSLELNTATSRLKGGGIWPLSGTDPFFLKLVDSHISLGELAGLAGIKLAGELDLDATFTGHLHDFGGEARLDGILFDRRLGPFVSDYAYRDGVLRFTDLNGRAFGGSVSGDLELDLVARPETYNAALDVRGIDLNEIVPNSFETNLSGRLLFAGAGLASNSFGLDLQVACRDGHFDFVTFDSLFGRLSLNVNDMFFHPGFTLLYRNSRFVAEGVVNYEGEMLLDGSFFTSQLADFWGDLFIEELSGGGRATYVVSGPNQDPNIKGSFSGDSCSFYGFSTDSVRAEFDIESFLYGRRGEVRMKAFASDVWSLPAESLLVDAAIDSDLVTITRAELFDRRTFMSARGEAVLHDSTASVSVQDFRFRFDSLSYTCDNPIAVEFLADRISVDDLKLTGEGGSAEIYCEYGYDSTVNLEVSIDTLPITPWLATLQVDTLISGRLTLAGKLSGRLANPRAEASGRIQSLNYGDAVVGDLSGSVSLADSNLTIGNVALDYQRSRTQLTGRLPLIMDLINGLVTVPEQEIDLRLHSQGDNLNLVSLSLDDLESLTGAYELELSIYGTAQRPQSRGQFSMTRGTAKLYQMENPIEDIQATIRSQDRHIFIDWVDGKVSYRGEKGELMATGEIEVLSRDLFDYDLQIRGANLPFKYDLGDVYARCDLDILEITGSDPPVARGNIIVYEADYFDEFEEESIIAAKEAADTISYVDYVINVEFLPASVRVRNSDVNMVLDGQLTVIREQARDNYIGVLKVVRGDYYLFDLTFEIEEGSEIIFDDIEQPNPALNIRAYTNIRNYVEGAGAGYHRLYLYIGGTLLQPEINAAEGSGYSDEDILSLLLWSSPASASRADVLGSSPLEQRVYDYLGRNISRKLTRTLGVERFEISPSYGQDRQISGAEISLGFYTIPNLYTYFTSPLAFGEAAELGFEYRIGRNVYLRGNRDRESYYHLNLNLNWDFK